MKFSIIIPVYNVEKYLEQCLNSVLSQTFTDYEVICVNDGSTDGSLEILHKYEQKITIINQENGGLSDARNTGIKVAKGDYIFLLDSDDWIVENALEILNKNIDGQDFISFNGKRFFESGKIEMLDEGVSETKLIGWKYYNKYALRTRKFHFVCTVLRLYRREFLIENRLFFKKGILHEDSLFTPICCYYAKNVKVIPDTLYIYRIREGSITQTPNNKKRTYDIVSNANDLAEFFIPKNIDKSMVYREIAGMYFSVFMPSPIVSVKEIKKHINWDYFKVVAQYPRQRRIYRCLSINYRLFQLYIWLERKIKVVLNR